MMHALRLALSALCLLSAVVPAAAQAPASTPAPSAGAPATPAAEPARPPSSGFPERPGSVIVERVLVRVNGEIFTQSQLTGKQIDQVRSMEGIDETNLEATIARITPDVLVEAVDELLLVQHGRELGLTFTDEQFNSAIENIKKQNKLDDEGLQAALKQEGTTLEELRQRFENSYLVSGVQQREIGPSMMITLEEQRQFYTKNSAQFMTPLTVTLRELFLAVPTQTQNGKEVFSVADEKRVNGEIVALRQRAIAGEDFEAIVKASSQSATRETGGLIGPVNVDDLSPALKELVAKLEPGNVSEPVRSTRGFQIFKLEARATPQLRPFDEVRSSIESAIRNERLGPEQDKLVARLRTAAVIEWKDEALRQLYEKRVAEKAAP